MAKPFERLVIRPARKRSSHELPPDELFEPTLLRRRTTLQSWAEAPRASDPKSFVTLTDEPAEYFPDQETSLLQIDRLDKRCEPMNWSPYRHRTNPST